MMKYIFIVLLSLLLFNSGFSKDPGDTVEPFVISNYDGNVYDLNNFPESKALIIIFWSTQCPFVQPYNDRINDFVKEYQEKGFVFWGINSNNTEPVSEVMEHTAKNGYVFPMLKDENNVVADLFEATRTPEVFILNKDRVILYHGRIEDNSYAEKVTSKDLKNALDEIFEGKDISVKSTKAFGCTIKRIN